MVHFILNNHFQPSFPSFVISLLDNRTEGRLASVIRIVSCATIKVLESFYSLLEAYISNFFWVTGMS